MNQKSLGDILRSSMEQEEKAKREKIEQEVRAAAAIEAANLRIVLAFFENAKAEFTAKITSGERIKGIKVGPRDNSDVARLLGTYGIRLTDSGHAQYAHWNAFCEWAKSNGLEAKWNDEHDGMGMESWHVLAVVPYQAP